MDREIIRVFARRTTMTPTDDLAFFDDPPLTLDLPDLPVCVSVTFSWDIARGYRLAESWRNRFSRVSIGGPAINGSAGQFVRGRFLADGITITSRGCPKRCPWCEVWKREGPIFECLQIEPGFIVQDNNLLACSRDHIMSVFAMLKQQSRGAIFRGGLDIDLIQVWHVDLLKSIRVSEIWVACDTDSSLAKLDKAADLLADFKGQKKRCYCLVGIEDTPARARQRCEQVLSKGFLPFAQLFQPADRWIEYSHEWKQLMREWCRPAAYLRSSRQS